MIATAEFSTIEIGKKRTTSRLPSVIPEVKEYKDFDSSEISTRWHQDYYNLYSQADHERKDGNHEEALKNYIHAQAFIKFLKLKCFEDDLILLREASLHYAIIQSYANFQMEPDQVMREFHNFGQVLLDFVLEIFKDDPNETEKINEIKKQIKNKNYIDVEKLLNLVKEYFICNKYDLDKEKIELIWRFAFFVTRYTGSMHDFYLRSTDLIDEGKRYYKKCKEASEIAIEAMHLLPHGYIPSSSVDISGKNEDTQKFHKAARKTLQDQTDTWLDVYNDFLDIEIEHILGNDIPDQTGNTDNDKVKESRKRKIEKLKKRSEYVLNKFKNGKEISYNNVEFALEIKAQTTFDDLIHNKIDYKEAIKTFIKLNFQCSKFELKRVQTIIQILAARAAIRFVQEQDALSACANLENLRKTELKEKRKSAHIFDKWIDVIKAEIQLMEINKKSEVNKKRQQTANKVKRVVNKETITITRNLSMEDLEKIEVIFDSYRLDTKSKKPKLSNRVLDAKIYYILGKVAFTKSKLLGLEYKKIKEQGGKKKFTKGPELLKAFMDCQTYLCEAHNNLVDAGYQGTRLFELIKSKYKRMLDYNDELLNDFRRPEEQNTNNSENFKMNEIAEDYRIQKWTDMVRKLLINNELAESQNYEFVLNNGIENALSSMIPTVNRTFIYEENKISGQLKGNDFSDINECVVNYMNGENETYLYDREEGRILKAMPIDEEKGRLLIMEIDMKLSKPSEKLINEILKGAKNLLNLNSMMKEMEELDQTSEEYNKKRKEVLKESQELFEYLFRRHKPTLGHQRELGYMCSKIAYYLNETMGLNIDPVIAEYAGILHDIGKLYLNPKLLLDIPRKYQPFERKETEKHAMEGPELLRGIPHFVKHFPELITLVFSHHIKYGLEPGYPVEAPGEKLRELPELLLGKLRNPTEEEKKALSYHFNDDYLWMARMMNPADQIQAVRSTDRNYRPQGAMPLKQLNGYLIRMAGNHFHPKAVVIIIEMIKRGLIGNTITASESDIKELRNFKMPKGIYSSMEIFEFVEENQNELETKCKVSLDMFLIQLGLSVDNNLLMTEEMVGRELCECYINMEGGDREKGRARFDKNKKLFFMKLKEKLESLGNNKVAPE